jgi:hypothetical protein
MKPEHFYEQLLKATSVDLETMDAARTKRDELGAKITAVIPKEFGSRRWISVGALAQGTQIAPLNDVDGVIEIEKAPFQWEINPDRAFEDVRAWLDPLIKGKLEVGTHAIKITFPDEDFTADVVIGIKQEFGLLIPHCPKDERHRWIATHPERHKQQVLERNRQIGSSMFTREIRILKHLNRRWKMADPQERKPLSSFHITALALKLLAKPGTHAEWTPVFLEQAAELVLRPLPDPAGVGEPIEARDSAYASRLLSEAGQQTRRALKVSEEEAEQILRNVFGDPARLDQIVTAPSVSVGAGGILGVPAAAAVRHTQPVRSHGEAHR